MDLKIDFTLVKGRWYMALKTKGYKATAALNAMLSSYLPNENHFVVRFTDSATENSILKAVISDKVDTEYKSCYNLSLFDMSGNLIDSHEECLRLVKDFNLPSEFYINYNFNSKW